MGEYLIDSNVFIEAYRRYYSFDIVPTFWERFLDVYLESVFIIDKVKTEICHESNSSKKDELQLWVENYCLDKEKIIYPNANQRMIDQYQKEIQHVAENPCYKAESLSEWTLSMDKADPWLIAIATVNKFTVVTSEQRNDNLSEKNPTKKEPRIPDICDYFDVECIDLFELMRREKCII